MTKSPSNSRGSLHPVHLSRRDRVGGRDRVNPAGSRTEVLLVPRPEHDRAAHSVVAILVLRREPGRGWVDLHPSDINRARHLVYLGARRSHSIHPDHRLAIAQKDAVTTPVRSGDARTRHCARKLAEISRIPLFDVLTLEERGEIVVGFVLVEFLKMSFRAL